MVGRIKQSQVSQDLLPPQGFGPDGQNPRTHSRGPRLLGTKISLQQKKSRFFKNRARKGLPKSTYAKDCRNFAGGRGNTRRSRERESLPRDSEVKREELHLN